MIKDKNAVEKSLIAHKMQISLIPQGSKWLYLTLYVVLANKDWSDTLKSIFRLWKND